jgi:hypothetical protein
LNQITFLGAVREQNIQNSRGAEYIQMLERLAGTDGATVFTQATRNIGNSGMADHLIVFEGSFNAAQQNYLERNRIVVTPADIDPSLLHIKHYPASQPTETKQSFAYLAPD